MSAERLREAATVLRDRAEPDDSELARTLADWLDAAAYEAIHLRGIVLHNSETIHLRIEPAALAVADAILDGPA